MEKHTTNTLAKQFLNQLTGNCVSDDAMLEQHAIKIIDDYSIGVRKYIYADNSVIAHEAFEIAEGYADCFCLQGYKHTCNNNNNNN